MLIPLVPWFDHQSIFDLYKFGQLYINKHIITNATSCTSSNKLTKFENQRVPQNLDNPSNWRTF